MPENPAEAKPYKHEHKGIYPYEYKYANNFHGKNLIPFKYFTIDGCVLKLSFKSDNSVNKNRAMVMYARRSHPAYAAQWDDRDRLDQWNCTTAEEKLSWMSPDEIGEDYV